MHAAEPVTTPARNRAVIALSAIAALVLAMIAGTAISAPIANAGGGANLELSAGVAEDRSLEVIEFDAEVLFGSGCDATEFTLYETDGTDPVDVTFETEGDAPLSGSFSVEGLAAGVYDLEFDCTLADVNPPPVTASFAFSRVTIDKQVDGDAPEDAEFVIRSDCEIVTDGEGLSENFAVDLAFDADGGERSFILDEATVLCFMTEPQDGGADERDFDLAEHTIETPSEVSVTATNTFVADEDDAVEDDGVEDEPDDDQDDDEEQDDDIEEEAAPADPVEEEPDYTG